MYTNQVQNLTSALSKIAKPADVQAIVQSLANCAQPLTTRGPFTSNGAASLRPPPGGIIEGPPNYITYINEITGDTITDWTNRNYNTPWNTVGGDVWNQQFFNPATTNNFYSGDNNYWGGDTFYGDNYLTNNNVVNNNSYLNNVLNNFDYTNNAYNNTTNNTLNNNYQNWYTQQFTDNSYTDFSTSNNFSTNQYNQTVNNFAGDNFFDNTYTTNETVNNNVTNLGDVINQGNVYNNANTYLTENKTYVTNEETTEEFNTYITNVVNGSETSIPFYRWVWGAIRVPTNAISGGSVTFDIPRNACKGGTITVTCTPATTVINNVTAAAIDPDTCEISLAKAEVEVVTGVTATAVFTPVGADKDAVAKNINGVAAAANPEAVITAFGEAGRIPVLGPL